MPPHNRRLTAAMQATENRTLSIRGAAKRFTVPYSTLRDRLVSVASGSHVSKPPGRRPCLSSGQEKMIEDAILDCADRGFPLSHADIADMVQVFVLRLPKHVRERLPFKNNRPGPDFVRSFLKRHSKIRMRRRAALEQKRKTAMSPHNMAMHFARLKKAYTRFEIVSPAQVFNIDESGVSTRTGGRGKGKAAMNAEGRSNAVELEFSSNAEHVTLMPVVSADGKAWPPVIVFPGVFHKFRVLPDGKKEFLHDYLPTDALVAHRTPAGIDSDLFYKWIDRFIEQTSELRKKHRYILLTMDAFGAHLSYRALQRLADNSIIAYALPAHTSHRTQVLDYAIFSPFKEYLRSQWSMRLLGTQAERSNDCFTLCDMLHKAYAEAVTYKNIVNGFSACGLWSLRGGGVDETVINASDLTNRGPNENGDECYTRYKDLVNDFMKSRDVLRSDGPNIINGHLNTTSGALCNREDLLRDLQRRETERAAERDARVLRDVEREERRVQKAAEVARKNAERVEADRVKQLNKQWDLNIQQRWRQLTESRAARRANARLRARMGK